jgi:putative addiction module killer protein
MIKITCTTKFDDWLKKLAEEDPRTAAEILVQLDLLARGNPFRVTPIGPEIAEMSINPGRYSIYFTQKGNVATILLGGDKSSREKDVKRAEIYAWE